MRDRKAWIVVGALISLSAVQVRPDVAAAGMPIYSSPVLSQVRVIRTNPFAGSTATHVVGDAEGLARDPVRNTLWLSDDGYLNPSLHGQLHEIDLVTGERRTLINTAQFAATPSFMPGGPVAGTSRIGDNEAVAYDKLTDTLYVFSGSCCSVSPHTPTIFRLKRPAPGAAFAPESYQPLEGHFPNDFSGADILNGVIWTAYRDNALSMNQLYTYDYATNVLSAPLHNLPGVGGWVSGLGFSEDGHDLWLTTTGNDLHRFSVPGFTQVPNYVWHDLRAVSAIRDGRAVEVIGDQLYIADGDDNHSTTSKSAHAIYVFEVTGTGAAPSASFTTNPTPASGYAPLAVTFTDVSTGAPTNWSWDFGDGSAPVITSNASHTYAQPGVYTATLTATNAAGAAVSSATVTVADAPTPPSPAFSVSPPGGTAPVLVAVTDASTAVPPVTSWQWDFGDGSPVAGGASATHTYMQAGTYEITLTVSNAVGPASTSRTVTVTAAPPPPPPPPPPPASPAFRGLAPIRLLDTRPAATIDGESSGIGPLAAGSVAQVRVVGRGDVPASGVAAVALNVTAIGPTAESYLTVWPSGTPRPTASNLNMAAGRTVPNLVVVPVAADGTVSIFNAAGVTDVAVDLLGWFPVGAGFTGVTPARLTDSRPAATVDGAERAAGPLAAGATRKVTVAGRGGVPPTGAQAVAINVTSVGASAESYLTVWPSGTERPTASNLNLVPGRAVANMVIVPVGSDGTISVFNAAGSTDLIVDVLGWFAAGRSFTALPGARLADSRPAPTIDGRLSGMGPVGAGEGRPIDVLGRGGVPASGVGAVVLNVTAVGGTATSYLTVWPSGARRPVASNLNIGPGDVVPNLVIVPLGGDGRVSVFNEAGSVGLVVDVLGWFPTVP